MRCRMPISMAVAMIFLFGVTSCNKPDKDTTIKLLKSGASTATNFGLRKWSEKDAPGAMECAKALKTNINDVLLPYFNGGNLPVSSEVQALLNSSLFKNVKPDVKDAIVAASIALDAVLPIPGTDKLNQDQVDYIKAFLSGIADGCGKFTSKEVLKHNWLQ